MRTSLVSGVLVGAIALFLAGCDPSVGGRYYGSSYDPFYNGYYGGPLYDPYYGSSYPYYVGGYYDRRSPWEAVRDYEQAHERKHEQLEYKYDKAMRRLDRQEREAQEKAYRKYGGNINDPRYQERLGEIDRKYDHKREKVERNLRKEHGRFHRDW